jgi:uncharacterized protein (DUF305 family)
MPVTIDQATIDRTERAIRVECENLHELRTIRGYDLQISAVRRHVAEVDEVINAHQQAVARATTIETRKTASDAVLAAQDFKQSILAALGTLVVQRRTAWRMAASRVQQTVTASLAREFEAAKAAHNPATGTEAVDFAMTLLAHHQGIRYRLPGEIMPPEVV